jgi:hypothetical protein
MGWWAASGTNTTSTAGTRPAASKSQPNTATDQGGRLLADAVITMGCARGLPAEYTSVHLSAPVDYRYHLVEDGLQPFGSA